MQYLTLKHYLKHFYTISIHSLMIFEKLHICSTKMFIPAIIIYLQFLQSKAKKEQAIKLISEKFNA